MDQAVIAVLGALAYLQAKHVVCDFTLQTPYQIHGKGLYGHPGGLIHAGIHGIGTIPVFAIITPTAELGAVIIAAEVVVHYHIDWLKEQIVRRAGLTAARGWYWVVVGVDQFLHQLTYIAIVAVLAAIALP